MHLSKEMLIQGYLQNRKESKQLLQILIFIIFISELQL